MVTEELGAYLAGAGLGLTLGTNLFGTAYPETSPDAAVALIEFEGEPDEGTFNGDLGEATFEHPAVKVIVRDAKDKAAIARASAKAVRLKLRRMTMRPLSGVMYHSITADPVAWLGWDQSGRPRYHFDLHITKAES